MNIRKYTDITIQAGEHSQYKRIVKESSIVPVKTTKTARAIS